MPTSHLMVIDDEPEMAGFVADVAESAGYRTTVISNPRCVLEAIDDSVTHIALDLVMPGTDGIELLRMLARTGCAAQIVLMSGFDKQVLSTAEELARTLGLCVLGHLEKPIRLTALEALLARHGPSHVVRTEKPETKETISKRELARAVREDQFVLHYQPQIEIETGRLDGIEALVRWQHPELGLVFPDQFIGLAEEMSLIDDLGWLVARKGLADLSTLQRSGTLRLSLNISAYSLHDLQLPDKLLALANQHRIFPGRVVLEITESGLARELAKALDILSRLRVKGFQLSIDDFGTGYAMMQQLRRVPANELKIDRGFVADALTQDSARAVAEKTIELGHQLGMRIVAEGVETIEQLEFLGARQCDFAQGYLFSKPIALADIRSIEGTRFRTSQLGSTRAA